MVIEIYMYEIANDCTQKSPDLLTAVTVRKYCTDLLTPSTVILGTFVSVQVKMSLPPFEEPIG